jgi:hypothetical protein
LFRTIYVLYIDVHTHPGIHGIDLYLVMIPLLDISGTVLVFQYAPRKPHNQFETAASQTGNLDSTSSMNTR